jgi:hypothetical protein
MCGWVHVPDNETGRTCVQRHAGDRGNSLHFNADCDGVGNGVVFSKTVIPE